MIHPSPECLARFEGDNGIDMAVTTVDALLPNGERRKVRIVLGHPFNPTRNPEDWAIRAELDGLEATGTPIVGIDQFHSIVLAMGFLISRLEDYRDSRRYKFFWDGEDEEFDPRDYFRIPIDQ